MRASHLPRTALLVALAAPALSQTTTWLRPGTLTTPGGAECALRWEATSMGSTTIPGASASGAWQPSQLEWLFVRDGGTQRNVSRELFAGTAFGEPGVARLRLTGPGVAMIGIDRVRRTERVAPADLEAFVASRVAEIVPVTQARRPVTVRRVESAKLLVRVIDDTGRVRPSPAASSKSGQRCEIRPLLDPTRGPFGGDLPFRVYLPAGSEGVRVQATHVPTGDVQECRTDAEGLGHVRLRAAGEWRVEAHRALPVADGSADLEIQSATLVFDVPGPERPTGGRSTKTEKGGK